MSSGNPINADFTKEELCFFLNLRGIHNKAGDSREELRALIKTPINPEEYRALQQFKNIPQAFVDDLEQDGWFNKNYETVKSKVEIYMRDRSNGSVFFIPPSSNAQGRTKIIKLLWYYHIRGFDIPNIPMQLTSEQQRTINQVVGVTVVNSGPGTGKTTTGAEKTLALACNKSNPQGVIVASYTNATANNIYDRMLERIDDAGDISDKPGKNIWVTTVDSFATEFLPDAVAKASRSGNFNGPIDLAIRDQSNAHRVFRNPDGTVRYYHIIIDEAQDIDDRRMQLLMDIYTTWEFKSITIIGDPRQRLNIGAGSKFQELIEKGITNEESYTFDRPLLINYKQSFRFNNPVHLELCNILSSKRPKCHVALTTAIPEDKQIPRDIAPLVEKVQNIEQIASTIIAFRDREIALGSICIISASTERNNATTRKLRLLKDLLARNGITTTSEKPIAGLIYVCSIQGSKGLEFDHVFFIGAEDYPGPFNAVYQDKNDGMSMSFVANTRARISMTWLCGASNRPPQGVPEEITVGGIAVAMENNTDIQRFSIRTDEIQFDEYRRFMDHNLFELPREQLPKRFDITPSTPAYMYEIISMVLCMSGGLVIPAWAEKIVPLLPSAFKQRLAQGTLYDLVSADGKIGCPDHYKEMFMELREEYDHTDVEKHKMYNELMTGKDSILESLEQINNIVMILADLIEKHTEPEEDDEPKHKVMNAKIKASMIETKKLILIFTDNLFLASLAMRRTMNIVDSKTGRIKPPKTVIAVSLSQGTLTKITNPRYKESQYEYMINALYTICVHKQLMQKRATFSIASMSRQRPWYFVDTEHIPRAWAKSYTVFDIAIINSLDVFSSMITMIDVGRENFKPTAMMGITVQYEDLVGFPKLQELQEFWFYKIGEARPIIYYYHASHDKAFFYEAHEMYDTSREPLSQNKVDWEFQEGNGVDYNIDFVNAREKGDKTQGETYDQVMKCSSDNMIHIIKHTAVGDAILLAEMTLTRRT